MTAMLYSLRRNICLSVNAYSPWVQTVFPKCFGIFKMLKLYFSDEIPLLCCEKITCLFTGNKVQFYFTEMNSRYFILPAKGEK